jgi:hypothetical protein
MALLIMVLVFAGIVLVWRLSLTKRRRNTHTTRYRLVDPMTPVDHLPPEDVSNAVGPGPLLQGDKLSHVPQDQTGSREPVR